MANFFTDNKDLQFQFEQINWQELIPIVEAGEPKDEQYGSIEETKTFYRDLLTQMGEYIANEIAPHSAELDEQHPTLLDNGEVEDPARLKKIMQGLNELGAISLSLPRRVGGMNTSIVVSYIVMEMLSRADSSVMSHYGFHFGIAQALDIYALEDASAKVENGRLLSTKYDAAISAICSGGEWGAMDLTEPDAGSDLGKIRTKAVEQEDGTWRINGSKIFITSGHGEHHIILARSEDKTNHGLKGLSLFYAAAHKEVDGKRVRNLEIGGLEEKMGHHSIVAATINYDDTEALLLGKRGHGFLNMLKLMNNARLAVGVESLGLIENAHRQAKAYAGERMSMGKPISEHEMIADYLDEMEITLAGLRAMVFTGVYYEETASRLSANLIKNPPKNSEDKRKLQQKIRQNRKRARHLTPLIKYIGGEESVHFSRMALQIFGGVGYVVETGVEKLIRDALLITIYEGTSQIQALMALKDNMAKVLKNPGRFFSLMATNRFDALRSRDSLTRGLAKMRLHVHSALQTILTTIAAGKLGDLKDVPIFKWKSSLVNDWDPSKDFSFGLLHAENLIKLLAWEAMTKALVKSARAAKGTKDEAERIEIAERFIERFEPKARGILILLEEKDGFYKRFLSKNDV